MDILEFMKRTAVQAGAIAFSDQQQLSSRNIHTKETAADLVTDTDRKVEQFIRQQISAQYPDFGFYGEENGKDHADREYCFIVDPIDGTASFIHQLDNWCVSIGLHYCGKPLIGVVCQPSVNRLYYAEKGKGAFCNGRRLSVSRRSRLGDSILSTGLYCLRAQWKEENNLKYINRIAPLLGDLRKFGSAALDCCVVASGALDAYWELCLAPYDVGAGEIIALEAGARITDLHGSDEYPDHGILVSNGLLHDQLLSFFTDYRSLHR